jgi:ribonuclease PH
MLPGSTGDRRRGRNRTKVDGRTQEIQRLIGRSPARRSPTCEPAGPPHDPRSTATSCRRTGARGRPAITGAYVALVRCASRRAGRSLGWWGDNVLACWRGGGERRRGGRRAACWTWTTSEDVAAAVDCNLVMHECRGEWVEVQATAEEGAYTDAATGRDDDASAARGSSSYSRCSRPPWQRDGTGGTVMVRYPRG